MSLMPSHLQELQSDAEFAEVFARSKWRQSKWAPSRIRMVCVMLHVMLLASAISRHTLQDMSLL